MANYSESTMAIPTLTTHSRRRVNPLGLRREDVAIEDIAHALAQINRFNGHVRAPISVAQHSVYVSRLCNGSALAGLLHDAAEAYLGDVTKWLKNTPEFAGYRAAEAALQARIYEWFGCEPSPEIEQADRLMVRFEGEQGYGGDWLVGHPAYPRLTADERARVGEWEPWPWARAEREFLARYAELTR